MQIQKTYKNWKISIYPASGMFGGSAHLPYPTTDHPRRFVSVLDITPDTVWEALKNSIGEIETETTTRKADRLNGEKALKDFAETEDFEVEDTPVDLFKKVFGPKTDGDAIT